MLAKMSVQILANILAGQHVGQNLGRRFRARARPNAFENGPKCMGQKKRSFRSEIVIAIMPTNFGHRLVVLQQIANPATHIILASRIAIPITTSITIAAPPCLLLLLLSQQLFGIYYHSDCSTNYGIQ